MTRRLLESIAALLRAINILCATLWLSPLYVLGLADRPSGRQMISCYVGKAMTNGWAWARVVGGLIDRGAILLGDRPDHCIRAYRHYRGLDQ